MTAEIKQEALEQLELDIKFGFEHEDEIFEHIREMFYDEDTFDEDWLRQTISEKYLKHAAENINWSHPTDFERLTKAFDDLAKQKIVCLHNAGYTKSDGESDCMDVIERLDKHGIKATGYCFYHSQDLERAVDPEIRNLYLGFDSRTQDNTEALLIGKKIVSALEGNGFQVDWSGTVTQRIEIKNINWQKVPDEQEWGVKRIMKLLSNSHEDKKPFWKFW